MAVFFAVGCAGHTAAPSPLLAYNQQGNPIQNDRPKTPAYTQTLSAPRTTTAEESQRQVEQLLDTDNEAERQAANERTQAGKRAWSICSGDFDELLIACAKACPLAPSVARRLEGDAHLTRVQIAKAMSGPCAKKHPSQCEFALLEADERLGADIYWRRSIELAASIDPVCRAAKADLDEKQRAVEEAHQQFQRDYDQAQADVRARLAADDAALRSTPPLPPVIIEEEPPSAPLFAPRLAPTYTHCFQTGNGFNCSTY